MAHWTCAALAGAAAMLAGAQFGPAQARQIMGRAGGTGPYKAVMEADPSLATHTIYRPADLAALRGAGLPIVVWGNGACANNGANFHVFLTEIASHGYLVVAIGPPDLAAADAPRPLRAPGAPDPGPPPGDDASRSSQLIDAINWAQAQNKAPGGRFKGRLAADRIAVMGQSCGGLQALDVSLDARVTTTMIWNSGVYNRPSGRSGIRVDKSKLARLHAPIAYVLGGPKDIAYENGMDDFARINHLPALVANLDVGHGGTYREPGGGRYAPVAVAWLGWLLKSDPKSAAMFVGPDCGLCKDPAWVVNKKNLP